MNRNEFRKHLDVVAVRTSGEVIQMMDDRGLLNGIDDDVRTDIEAETFEICKAAICCTARQSE